MNCDDYQHEIAADPSFDGGAGHLADCAACRDYRKQMQSLDELIGRALAVDVPELKMPDLDSVTTDNVVSLRARKRLSVPSWLAVAATVTLAAVLGMQMLGRDFDDQALAAQVVEHLTHEPYSLQVTDVAVSDARLNSVVPATVANMNHDAGLITYAESCIINGHSVPHLVIQGQNGPITILLMPNEAVSAAFTLPGDEINGVILPVGDGSIAIIGEKDEPIEKITDQVRNSVTWST